MSAVTHDVVAPGAPRGDGRRHAPGLALAVVSAVSFGLSGALGRGLMDAGWSAASAVAARILLAALVLAGPALVALRGRWALLRRHARLVVVYGVVAVAGCQLAYFNAVAHMAVGVALLVEYTAPVVVVAWLWLRHAQRPGLLTVGGAALALAGLLLVLDLTSGARVSPVGLLWACGAMLGVACFFVLSSQEDDALPGTVLAAGGLAVGGVALLVAGGLGLLPLAASTRPVVFRGSTVAWWVPVLALGLVTAALAYVTGIAASRRLGSRLASFLGLGEVLAALGFAWLLLGELPRPVQVTGGLLVLAGVVVVRLGERVTARPDDGRTPR